MYKEAKERERRRAEKVPLTTIPCKGSEIIFFRADTLEAGVKSAIGRCLVARAIETGQINASTKALVVQGAGNTVTAVHDAVREMHLRLKVVAVVYAETSQGVRERLAKRGLTVVAETPRTEGQTGRRHTTAALCAENLGYVLIEQHEQPAIIEIQKETFGRAITQVMAESATHFVAGVGTGGTLFGISSALREANPSLHTVGVEGVGSTLSLWHAYLQARGTGFAAEKQAIEQALAAYRDAGMLTNLDCYPDANPDEWFAITIDFPPDTHGVLGIEGLGVGNPTQLMMDNLSSVSAVRIVTDAQAHDGVRSLASHNINAVSSAGANFYAAMRIAEELERTGQRGRIVTVVTAKPT